MTEPRIFISYARSDGETFATELRERLAAEIGEEQLWQDRARMEGGVGWWQQIAEAIEKVDFMVLLATPKAMASEVVKKEWRYARQQGVCVYPVQVPGLPVDFAKLPRWMRDSHFYNLDKEWETFVNYLKNPCHAVKVPFMAPDLPTHFVERPAKFNELVTKLLDSDRQNPVAITTALRGAGGFGKTTLAAALCHDDDVQTAFDDGVLWVTLGENPDTLGGLTKLYAALTGERPSFVDTEDAANHLTEKLAELDCLIVIDDVWNPAHLRPFLRGGERCARLITTRLMDVAVGANAETTEVDEMTAEESVAMLAGGINLTPSPSPTGEGSKAGNLTLVSEGLKAALRKLAGRLGEWPLMLELANGALRKRMARGDTVEHAIDYLNDLLTEEGAGAFDPRNPQERNQAIGASVGASLRLLENDERERLCELAIFKDDIDIPIEQLERLWGARGREAERLCELYADLSLVKFNLEDDSVRLHDVIRDYLGRQLENAASVHARLIDSWGDPYDLIDVFAWQWLAYHLNQAGQHERLRELLLDYAWLKERLRGRSVILGKPLGKRGRILGPDVNGLIADYNYASTDSDLQLVQSALMMSAHVILQDHRQLAAQLRGRLFAHNDKPKITTFIQTLTYSRGTFAALDAPMNSTHNPAGGALLRTLVGHTEWVNGVVELEDGRLLSWSKDGTLRLWGSDGAALATLHGHKDAVLGALQLADSRLLSWSDDRTLRLWGSDGSTLAELQGHTKEVTGSVALGDGRLLSWSSDGMLRLWGSDGTALAYLQGHTFYIKGAMALGDGRLVSWSSDGTLRLWGHDGMALAELRGHTNVVTGVVALADGRLLSWSNDNTLRLWTTDGTALAELRGHTDGGLGALELSDGRLLSWSYDGTLRLWGNDGTALAELGGHMKVVMGALELSDGRLLSWANDRTLRLWRSDGTPLAELGGHTKAVMGALELRDRRLLSWSSDGRLRLWGRDGVALAKLQGHTNGVLGAIVLTDGRLLSWSYDRTLRLWGSNNTRLAELGGHTDMVRGAVALGDKRLLSWSDDRTLRLWGSDGTALAELRGHTTGVTGATALGDERLLSWSDDRTLRLWGSDGTVLTELQGHTDIVRGAVILGDGRMLSWSSDRTLRLWGNDGTVLAELRGHTTGITGAAVLGDGRFLSWANNNTLRLWGSDGTALAELQGHTKVVRGAIALGDGRLLSWSDDRTLRLWNSDGTALAELQGHTSYINGVLVSAGGRVLSWSRDGTLRVWDLETYQQIAAFYGDAPITCCAMLDENPLTVAAGDNQGRVMFLRLVE